MKEITISFTADELRELAKQLYLGSFLTIGFPYDNEKMTGMSLTGYVLQGILKRRNWAPSGAVLSLQLRTIYYLH